MLTNVYKYIYVIDKYINKYMYVDKCIQIHICDLRRYLDLNVYHI
jgi:hypothetical protein